MTVDNLVVVKGNNIIESSYSLTLVEKRILLGCISKIDSTQQFTRKNGFTIRVDEIKDLVTERTSKNSLYSQVKNGMDRLGERWLNLNETGSDKVRWIYRKKYNDDEGSITLYFTDEILPFLCELKGNFTKYKLHYVSKFSSVHSIRIYELLVQWLVKGSREVEVEQLKKMLGIESKYTRSSNFIEKVIKTSLNDINTHSNITVTFGVRKTGKRVTHIQFEFKEKTKSPNTISKSKHKIPLPKDIFQKTSSEEREILVEEFANSRKRFGNAVNESSIPADIVEILKSQGRW
jgi:plasmid replication initiation protein